MNSKLTPHAVGSMLALALGLLLAPSPAEAQVEHPRYHSSAVGVADGQYVRLNAFYVDSEPSRPELPPGPCRLTLRLLDAAGATLSESVVSLPAGRDTVLDFQPEGLRPGERATVRAEVIAEPDSNGLAPIVKTTLDVVDKATGRTAVADPGTPNGGGLPRTDTGIFALTSLQIGRINATYVGFPDESGLPPGPCRVTLTLFNGAGRVLVTRDVEASPGQTVSLDFPAGFMVEGVRRRLWAKATTDGREQGFVTAAVEVFDEDSGRSTVLYPGQIAGSWGWEFGSWGWE